ncbi:MAG: SurA N-terminal domain-containing protein [Bacteroidota bacterium]
MAVINTLRDKMGKVVVGVIAFSIASFVLADLLGPNSTLLGGNDTTVGEIDGQTVSFQDFQTKLEEMSYNYALNTGRNPSGNEMNTVRQQTWDALINDIAFQNQFNQLGVEVTEEEVIDMVQGNNIAPQIRQSFTDPQTGQFNRDQVIQFLQSLANQPAQQQASWYAFESNLGPARVRTKYENLLVTSNNATSLEGAAEYKSAGSNASIKYLYVPYLSVSDEEVEVSESELETYLSDNADSYDRDASTSLNYVIFEMTPSAEDSTFVLEDLESIKTTLETSSNDSAYARANSDGYNAYTNVNAGGVPDQLKEDGEIVPVGTIVGPTLQGDKYTLYKLSAITEGGTAAARASHILINWADDSDDAKAEAKNEATRILNEIKRGSDFAEQARLYGTDGTASRGGDLGWFETGRMVAEFEEAVFEATSTGLLSDVVETQFGYHIIDVTETKTTQRFGVVQIEKDIIASDETRDRAYRQADMFSASSDDLASFSANAEEAGVELQSASRIGQNDTRLGTITNARGIVMWAYAQASVGDVSDVYELDEGYVIAALTGEQDKGTARLEDVRNEVENKVKNAKKADLISGKLEASSGSLDDIAAAYGEDANVYSMTDLKLSANSLTSVGVAPEAVGVAFSLENGEKTTPFAIDNGVVIIEMVDKTEPAELSDYQAYAETIETRRRGRIGFAIDNAIKEFAAIVDERYKFF